MGRGLQVEQLLIISLDWGIGFSIAAVGSQHCYATEHASPLEYHESWDWEGKNVLEYV